MEDEQVERNSFLFLSYEIRKGETINLLTDLNANNINRMN